MTPPDGAGDKDTGVPPGGDARQVVRRAWEQATPWEPAPGPEPEDGPPVGDDYGDWSAEDGRETPPDMPMPPGLPDDCPVVPLGVQGKICYYLDALCQLQEVHWKDHQRTIIQGMFGAGARDYLRRHWPRKSQDKNTGEWITTGWMPEEVCFAMTQDCAAKGVWSPRARVRGAGAWKAVDGALILHCGNRVFRFPVDGGTVTSNPPGVVGEHVYPAAAPTPRPWDDPQPAGRGDGPGWRLLGILKTWNWARPKIDPVLLLGWICAGMIGGALKFRPMIWIPGEFGTGKSSLQDLIKWLMGTTGLLSVANASAAGIQQTLGYASLPAALDEQESSADNRKVTSIVELAREASTGAVRVRGGSDQNAHSFNIQSAFVFSSILMPSMEPQDVSRFAVLDLRELVKGAKPPQIGEVEMGELGRRILRRLVDGWPRFAATLAAYRDMLMESGKHSGRGADLFGTLLACADLVLSDALPQPEALAQWAKLLDATKLAELDGAMNDKSSCLNYLVTSTLTDQHNRRERTIAQWAGIAHTEPGHTEEARLHANQMLALHGLKIYPREGYHYLAVSNNHQGVAAIYRDTKWAATPGNPGVWRQSLGRLPGAVIGHQVKFPPNNRAVLVPLSLFLPDVSAPPGAAQDPSAAGRPPDPEQAAQHRGDGAGARSAADTASHDPLAAGGSPDPVEAAQHHGAEASRRSAANSAQSNLAAPTQREPDPFDLSTLEP